MTDTVLEQPSATVTDTAPGVPETPSAAPVEVAAPAAGEQPKSMLEAISQGLERDELGRFKSKAEAAPGQDAPAKAETAPAKAADPAAPKPAEAAPEDLTSMPEGLGGKAQERFQKLATGLKERDAQIQTLTQQNEQAQQQIGYIRDTFQQHGITQPQFEQAVQVVGMLNRGDLEGALRALDQQRQQISLALGKPLPGVDALSDFPDLRAAVDGLEMTEARALEVARMRQSQLVGQQRAHQAQQQQMQAHQAEQEFQQAQNAVDAFCKQMAASDLDYPAIEAQLLPDLKALLAPLPPSAWPQAVQTQYGLLKRAASTFRRTSSTGVDTTPLRATGAASPAARPTSMHEAMWGRPAPGM